MNMQSSAWIQGNKPLHLLALFLELLEIKICKFCTAVITLAIVILFLFPAVFVVALEKNISGLH